MRLEFFLCQIIFTYLDFSEGDVSVTEKQGSKHSRWMIADLSGKETDFWEKNPSMTNVWVEGNEARGE
jgi:hypothetical protein